MVSDVLDKPLEPRPLPVRARVALLVVKLLQVGPALGVAEQVLGRHDDQGLAEVPVDLEEGARREALQSVDDPDHAAKYYNSLISDQTGTEARGSPGESRKTSNTERHLRVGLNQL